MSDLAARPGKYGSIGLQRGDLNVTNIAWVTKTKIFFGQLKSDFFLHDLRKGNSLHCGHDEAYSLLKPA
jgi:hypothetical protein